MPYGHVFFLDVVVSFIMFVRFVPFRPFVPFVPFVPFLVLSSPFKHRRPCFSSARLTIQFFDTNRPLLLRIKCSIVFPPPPMPCQGRAPFRNRRCMYRKDAVVALQNNCCCRQMKPRAHRCKLRDTCLPLTPLSSMICNNEGKVDANHTQHAKCAAVSLWLG